MNDADLQSQIKAIRAPERSEEYWESFPERVLRASRAPAVAQPEPRSFVPGFLWGFRLALTCAALAFCLWESNVPKVVTRALRKDEKQLRESVQRFDRNLASFMRDEHGLHNLVADPS